MPKAYVLRDFDLVREDGTEQRFLKGVNEFTDADFGHWQVQGNIMGGDTLPPKPGSYEYHTVHPTVANMNDTLASHAAAEEAAVAADEAEFAEMRSQRMAERRKGYEQSIAEAQSMSVEDIAKRKQDFQQKYFKQSTQGMSDLPPPADGVDDEPDDASLTEEQKVEKKSGRMALNKPAPAPVA